MSDVKSSKDVSVSLRVQDDPELFVFGSPEATKVVQDALWGRGLTDGRIAVANLPSNLRSLLDEYLAEYDTPSPDLLLRRRLRERLREALKQPVETQADPTKWPMPPPPATWMPQWLREFHCQCEPAGDGAGQCVACQAADLIASSAQNGPARHEPVTICSCVWNDDYTAIITADRHCGTHGNSSLTGSASTRGDERG
jgi:hypothetical protein